MITVTAYFAIVCYTATIASCQTFPMLPDAAACTQILAKVKLKHVGARLDECDSYRSLQVSQTGTLPPLAGGAEYLTTGPKQ